MPLLSEVDGKVMKQPLILSLTLMIHQKKRSLLVYPIKISLIPLTLMDLQSGHDKVSLLVVCPC